MPRTLWTPDRRRGDRRLVPFLLHAHMQGADAPVRVHELGPGGMVVESARPLMAGDRVTFTLGSGADATGPMEGYVAHSRLILARRDGESPVCLAGVAFEHVTAVQWDRVAAWLAAIDQSRNHGSTQVP